MRMLKRYTAVAVQFCLLDMLQRYADAYFCLERKYGRQFGVNSVFQQFEAIYQITNC